PLRSRRFGASTRSRSATAVAARSPKPSSRRSSTRSTVGSRTSTAGSSSSTTANHGRRLRLAPEPPGPEPRMHINQLLQTAVASGASDLHLKVGSYPMMRVNGTLVVASEEKRLDRSDTESIAQGLLGPEQVKRFQEQQDVDLAYSIDGLGRFRCNVFQQRGSVGLVLRVIPTRIKTI